MKIIHHTKLKVSMLLLISMGTFVACDDSYLDEVPKSFFNPEVTLVNKAGFETSMSSIYTGIRDGYFANDGRNNTFLIFHEGTDINMTPDAEYKDYVQYVTPVMTQASHIWNLAYQTIFPRANMIIEYAEKPTVQWADEKEKNAIVAEARFFRAYGHNMLANLFGGVPIADQFYKEPKLDFMRASREEVYKFAAADLEFAVQNLPETAPTKGRVSKAAADHLPAEVYISLGRYDDAIKSATNIIESGGKYKLMTARFGKYKGEPGDPYSDLFKETNQNSAENTETIWALQMEYNVPGGGLYRMCRYWNSQYYNIKDPDGKAGMVLADSLGRPNGWSRGTPHVYYGVWTDQNDMRRSPHNIRYVFYNNNPESAYFGQPIDKNTYEVDTMRTFYPTIRKMEGIFYDGASSPIIYVDQYVMRLAETYLLRAEAYLKKGDLEKAAADINEVRSRANATPATAGEINMDYILDERIRELTVEEPRRLTLTRTGMLVERVRKYHKSGGSATIQDYHAFYPIPQTAIDANIGAKLEQNEGY